ncbi:MAG TPA: hypothetical protein VHV51_00170 [Polyangiaceae bacterium]|nr:hypothetical protein [Polyangiaceae bacterium]
MSSSEPQHVTAIVEQLLAEHADRVSLDQVAEAVGAAPITFDEIELVLDRLEAAGRRVETEALDPPAALAKVLATVRSFSALSGRRPTLAEIAAHSGLELGEVRFALLYARVLTR